MTDMLSKLFQRKPRKLTGRIQFRDLGYVRVPMRGNANPEVLQLRPANPEVQARFERVMWGLRQIENG
jgi:hypothetical protein